MELTKEEIDALKKVEEWVKDKDWRKIDEGYFEACVLALLLDRSALEVNLLANELIKLKTDKI